MIVRVEVVVVVVRECGSESNNLSVGEGGEALLCEGYVLKESPKFRRHEYVGPL
jgi:hypothetical protein